MEGKKEHSISLFPVFSYCEEIDFVLGQSLNLELKLFGTLRGGDLRKQIFVLSMFSQDVFYLG